MTSAPTVTQPAPASQVDPPVNRASTVAAAAVAVELAGDVAIRPFHFQASDEDLADLKRQILQAQWPEKETVNDETQGVQLATIQKLASYWATEHDWRKSRYDEARPVPAVHHQYRWPRHPFHPR